MNQVTRAHGARGREAPSAIIAGRTCTRSRWAKALRRGVTALAWVMAVAPSLAWAAGCDDKLGETVQVTGAYVPAGQGYAQTFVFAFRLDCHGTQELVTVQRSTGNLPVCSPAQPVEVVGKLVWNRALVDGHYEINNPASVNCIQTAEAAPKSVEPRDAPAPAPVAPAPRPEPPHAAARAAPSSVWVGRYRDSRGAGDVTFTLVQGTSTVAGTWRLRTGGGGPVAGTIEGEERRLQFHMENLAPECRGTFHGVAELGASTLVGTYVGQDCEGAVTGGRLDLRAQ